MTNITAVVESDKTRSWIEPVYVTVADGYYTEENTPDYPDLWGVKKFKSVNSGMTRRKSPGHGGREVPSGKSVVYVSVEGESLWDDIAARGNRPYTAWRPYVEQALRDHGFEFSKLTWSNKAGCSCPCSAGFIVSTGTYGHDIWVKLTVTEPQVVDMALRNARAASLVADPTLPVEFVDA
jgi:hypothetical protein